MTSFTRNLKDLASHFSRHNAITRNKIREIQYLDTLPESQLEEKKKELAKSLIHYAVTHSKFYKRLYDGHSLQGRFYDFYEGLPVIKKTDIKNKQKDIATSPAGFLSKAYTSGTSGSPLMVYRSPSVILNEYAYVWYYRMRHGIKKGDPIVSLRGELNMHQLHYFNKAENILYLSRYLLSEKNISTYAKLIMEFRPEAIFAYPSSVYSLVRLLEMNNYKMEVPLIFTSSEIVYGYQRDAVESYFSGKLFDWYGNVERTIAIGQCEHGSYHEMPLYGVTTYLEKGIITTPLINKAFPLIRYFVDDKIVKLNEPCACGKEHVIKSIDGRASDALILADGTQIGVAGLDQIFKDVNNILFAQIIQDSDDHIKVNLVQTPGFNQENREHLLKNIRLRLPESLNVSFNSIEEDQLIKTKAGKFKLIISNVQRNKFQ